MQLELEPFLHSLQFLTEVPLTSEPLRIDLLIIKKPPSLSIPKNIARQFRTINLIEYKSPQDRISLHSFHKALAYTFLYASLHKVALEDMTLNIIGNRHPRELFKALRERVVEREQGIYEVAGYGVPVQVIEGKRLETAENLWLRGLEGGLNAEVLGAILEESKKRDRAGLGAYLYAVLEANAKIVKEVTGMGKKRLTLHDVLEESGMTAEWEKRGEIRGKEGKAAEIAGKLKKIGIPLEQIVESTGLAAERIRDL
jgi:hypothetical protein